MGVKPRQKWQMVSPGRCLVRFALRQDPFRIWLQDSTNGVEAFFRRSFTSVGERHAVEGRHQRIRPLHVIALVLDQGTVSVIVELLHQPDEHIGHIIQRAGDLNENQGSGERQTPLRTIRAYAELGMSAIMRSARSCGVFTANGC